MESAFEVIWCLGWEVWCWLAHALRYGLEFHDAAFEAAEGVSDVEGEAEALHDQKLRLDYVFQCWAAGDYFCELAEGEVVVVCFCGEEEGAEHD